MFSAIGCIVYDGMTANQRPIQPLSITTCPMQGLGELQELIQAVIRRVAEYILDKSPAHSSALTYTETNNTSFHTSTGTGNLESPSHLTCITTRMQVRYPEYPEGTNTIYCKLSKMNVTSNSYSYNKSQRGQA